jgi:hypothetical protein
MLDVDPSAMTLPNELRFSRVHYRTRWPGISVENQAGILDCGKPELS